MKMNRRMKAVVSTNLLSFCASPTSTAKPFLVSEHDAEHENGHEARGLQSARGKIGADDGDQRHDGCIFGEHGPALMCDQQCCEIAERRAPARIPVAACLNSSST